MCVGCSTDYLMADDAGFINAYKAKQSYTVTHQNLCFQYFNSPLQFLILCFIKLHAHVTLQFREIRNSCYVFLFAIQAAKLIDLLFHEL